jgi:uncharacterized protein (DUF427 family)
LSHNEVTGIGFARQRTKHATSRNAGRLPVAFLFIQRTPGDTTMSTDLNDGHEAANRLAITSNARRCRVIHQGVTYADTHAALTLAEAGHDNVHYFPRADVNMARLERSIHTSHCPHKGEATHYHLLTEDGPVENAAWSYESPLDGAAQIKGYLAFYSSRVDRIDETS